MQPGKKIKVLVVDDSIIYREILSKGISTDSSIEVVATAYDAFDACDKVIEYEPDVITCDVEMPKINGIEFIRQLIPRHPLPVIVVSALSNAVFDSMNAGAVDFVSKPDIKSVKSIENFIGELIMKVKIASNAKVLNFNNRGCSLNRIYNNSNSSNYKMIAIGASTGGTEAIYNLLRYLPLNIPGIVIVQHIPPGFSSMFAQRLNNTTEFSVKEAVTGDYIEKGTVLVAPGDKHMLVRKEGEKYRVECIKGDKVNGHCPSVDVLFESVAKEVLGQAIGIILTGMGHDGAKGLLSMRRNGARTIGQDEGSSIVFGMPKVAYNIGAVEKQASLRQIPELIYSFLY